jgi:XTP/dITP diphosphohydrolase
MALADDSGLEIDALDGEPGIYSARYGGAGLNDSERNLLVLEKLEKIPLAERGARFVCVAVIVDETGRAEEFRGALEGYIGWECKGSEGFGYDPIFFLHDSEKSLAELGLEVKNRISHRAIAMQQVRSYLERYLEDRGAQKGL